MLNKIYRRLFRYKLLEAQMNTYVKEMMLINDAIAQHLGIGINIDMKAGTSYATKLTDLLESSRKATTESANAPTPVTLKKRNEDG